MEIRYLEQAENGRTRTLYETVFPEDEKAFVDAYYEIKAKDNRILVAEEAGEILSMLHRNPYTFRMQGDLVRADYIVAVATQKEWRSRGLMRSLLTKALQDMEQEGHPFTFLMPAAEAIYTPYDFRWMGNVDRLEKDMENPEYLAKAFDLYVEKDSDYIRRHIVWPGWEKTPLMLRLLDIEVFVKNFRTEKTQQFVLEVEDPILEKNNGIFCLETGPDGGKWYAHNACPDWKVSIADLGRFFFGKMAEEEYPASFREIPVLGAIYINETV